jgi:hypothetical protein
MRNLGLISIESRDAVNLFKSHFALSEMGFFNLYNTKKIKKLASFTNNENVKGIKINQFCSIKICLLINIITFKKH